MRVALLYIVLCELWIGVSIASNPIFPINSYSLAFKNGNRLFNSDSQYTKPARIDRAPFVIEFSNSNNKEKPSFRDDGPTLPGTFIFPGRSTLKGIKIQDSISESSILFPTRMPSKEISSTTKISAENCKIKDGNIMFMNECKTLLQEDPCLPEQWLLLDKNGVPYCAKRSCKLGELFFKGDCVKSGDATVCEASEILYIEFTGEVYCDCLPFHIFDPSVKKCFLQQTKGTCNVGNYLDLDSDNNVVCVDNPCVQDEFIKNPENGECYKKLYIGKCQDIGEKLVFTSKKTAICARIDNRNIFEVPVLTSCPNGSKRNLLGNCRKVMRIKPNDPFSHRVPFQQVSKYSQCQQGSSKYPDGFCRKINILLGK